MYRLILGLSSVGWLAFQGPTMAQPVRADDAAPTKTISIYNNSKTETIYPVIQAPIKNGADVADLWMQAQFKISVADYKTRTFQSSKLYRIWINKDTGIPPGGSVTISLPFYEQLLAVTDEDRGKVSDQYIDWWNAMRVYLFDGKDAAQAGFNYSLDNSNPQQPIPPPVVKPLSVTEETPKCSSNSGPCSLIVNSYIVGFPLPLPAQLVEYTLASAEGPPNAPAFSINLGQVNYNISGVDSMYLPAAIGAHGNKTAENLYLGSAEKVGDFRSKLAAFSQNGDLWPDYVPAYYDPQNPTIPLPTPPSGVKAYPLPQVPSAQTLYQESWRNPPPAPPTLSSDTLAGGIGKLGDVGQAMLDLWTTCTGSTKVSATCTKIRALNQFFVDDYKACFGTTPVLSTPKELGDYLSQVYGWAQFPNCSKSLYLQQPNAYPAAIKNYCDLQYNFFDPKVSPADVFNPYVQLVHVTLASNAYAFSIDDQQAFLSLPGDGIIITVAGTNGLENPKQKPLPTSTTYHEFCQSAPKK